MLGQGILLRNSNFIYCLFSGKNLIKIRDKEKWVYSDYGIAFVRAGLWNFDNEFAKIDVTFGVDISSSSHTGNRINHFLV